MIDDENRNSQETLHPLQEENGVGYRELYACAFKIEKIFQNFTNKTLKENGLMEISIENQPTLITLSNGNIIWKSDI